MGSHVHRLSGIDTTTRTAVCASCGPVRVWPRRTGWRCAGQAQPRPDSVHRLSEVDAEKRTANCSLCGPVGIRVAHRLNAAGEKTPYYQCNTAYAAKQARYARKQRYGMTQEDFNALLAAQDGRCASCNDPLPSPHVDHDHVTGEVRGLLCLPCNTGLGLFRDDVSRLLSAADYLNRKAVASCHS